MKLNTIWLGIVLISFCLRVSAQNVGIGDIAIPATTLHVGGNVISDSLSGSNAYPRVYADKDGTLFIGRWHTYSIHPSKFSSSSPDIRHTQRYTYDVSTGKTPMYAEVNLPDGAKVTKISVSIYDNSVGNLRVDLIDSAPFAAPGACGAPSETKGAVVSSGASTTIGVYTDSTINCPYRTTQQFLKIQPVGGNWDSGNLRIAGIWISYTY